MQYPQGHGAIERFHRTAYKQVLRSLDGAADVDPDPDALTLRLRHAQRLAYYATLRLLSREEVRAYVAHRCTIAGPERSLR